MSRAAPVLAAALLAVSCGAPLMKLPERPGAPAPDGPDALAQATAACRGVGTLTAEIAARGTAGGHRVSGRLSAGVAAPASVRLEAIAPFGPPAFVFVATLDDATVLLPRDDRVLEHGRPGVVLAALTGVPLGPADLRAALTGCGSAGLAPALVRRAGDDWRVVPAADGDLYLHRERNGAPWRLVAAVRRGGGGQPGWRVEYRDFQNELPRAIRVVSPDGDPRAPAFDLRLALSQVEVNVPLEDDVFSIQVPASAAPISVDELRRSGPLGSRGRDATSDAR